MATKTKNSFILCIPFLRETQSVLPTFALTPLTLKRVNYAKLPKRTHSV
ncbi:hypothetical protein HAL013_03120 [Helicobacter ailurogastricus]|uniref:Uncharacterized protein n=1 Tax=Helicobacter ailurogastricus TaxID=1578720 RepID=A0A0K2X7Z1_9HELI|nr:hypothetical protein HAL011_15850 [Helicobacter ailurogastricus]CRF42153.1 hypothetical protein HAL013_03120 [Helicobacter ailurogastricus]CRF43485.1 hypothetical protein HAL09_00260 [Helicobacter ailurogastricus]